MLVTWEMSSRLSLSEEKEKLFLKVTELFLAALFLAGCLLAFPGLALPAWDTLLPAWDTLLPARLPPSLAFLPPPPSPSSRVAAVCCRCRSTWKHSVYLFPF